MKPWLRYDLFGRVSTSDALAVACLAAQKTRTVSEAALFEKQSLHLQAGVRAAAISNKGANHMNLSTTALGKGTCQTEVRCLFD